MTSPDHCVTGAVFGILIQNQLPRVEQCLAKQASKSQFEVYDALLEHLGTYEVRLGFPRLKYLDTAVQRIYDMVSSYLDCCNSLLY